MKHIFLSFILVCTSANCLADIAIIAHPGASLAVMDEGQITRIYLGKAKTFPNGDPVKPADQTRNSPSRDEFNQKVLKKNESQLKSYWSKLIFTGKGNPPETVGDDKGMLAWVASHEDGLGYVDAALVD
ncbi:MAG TPA: phosphate ABC transporter substrate-binding protein, partial [Gammaproteobacteria bacterium]|nr:phosphate ABC transporter substrate-binding protein [Gammaproteobacteria bacterium]